MSKEDYALARESGLDARSCQCILRYGIAGLRGFPAERMATELKNVGKATAKRVRDWLDVYDGPITGGPITSDESIGGISLRDFFAGMALIGILGSRRGFLTDVGTDNAPGWAYQTADAMLTERAKAGAS